MNDKQQLEDIKEVYNKLGKITQMDIQWLFEQVELYHECREDALQLDQQNQRYKQALEEILSEASSYMGSSAANRLYEIARESLKE